MVRLVAEKMKENDRKSILSSVALI
uniref:Uncharacterized protein n=1 Tax=Rhizophora mucronata TaxID=61149 RepID=A0A2P2PGG1_RHIMU